MVKISPKTIALFAVTVVIVVYIFITVLGQRTERGSGETRAALPMSQITPTYAEKGEITSGFPKEFILDARAKPTDSYAMNYDQNLNQYTTVFDSGQSMEELYNLYLAYFKGNGWNIVNAITKYPASRGLYAKKGNTEASVAVLAADHSVQVSVSYVVK